MNDDYTGGTYMSDKMFRDTIMMGKTQRRKNMWRRSNLTKKEIKARGDARKNKIELERLKGIYANLQIQDPYRDIEETLRSQDLKVNQKQAEFQRDAFNQNQVNMLHSLRSASGSSGTASLAQKLLTQGMLTSRQASASIGSQESKNQELLTQHAQKTQELQRSGRNIPAQFNSKKFGMLMGLTQDEYALHKQQELAYYQAYKKQKQEAAQLEASSAVGFFKGMMGVGKGMDAVAALG